ncbi:hypothetical protein HHK36_015665 [Tetracentron sinense]|uniref:Uncharacterized protein n=1 Tax=Tetracentron sinense TaxID=13715 RepID=A0A834Z2M1_TETSI|nr:hypothetical protein HHK36_015665 [Tetracentron sinense]
MEFARVLVTGFLVSWVFTVGGEAVMGLPPCDFPAIYNFGDSNSDTGGISAAFSPIPPPNGETFFRRPSGRVCDGRLLIDFMAEHLGLQYLSPYLDSIGTNFRHGANFATGGSTIRRQNETIFQSGASPFSLDVQIVQFDQFKARTSDLYNQAKKPSDRSKLPRPEDFSKAIYTLDIGQNDLAAGIRKMSYEQILASIPDILDQFSGAVQNLHQQGARTFWIHNTGPIGCLPASRMFFYTPKPGLLDQHGCIKAHNTMAVEFNRQLKDRVIKLRAQLPHASLTYIDIYAAKYGLISNTKNQGFVEPLKICCGHHEGYHVWCGQKENINGTEVYGGSCGNPSAYVSWDGVHYSHAANHWIANHVLNDEAGYCYFAVNGGDRPLSPARLCSPRGGLFPGAFAKGDRYGGLLRCCLGNKIGKKGFDERRREAMMGLPPCDFPAIYNFGDSNSDTGSISAAFLPVPPPNGDSFFRRPSGRVCDGRLLIDFIAEHLGLPYLSPYLDSIGTNFRHGANFATAGSTIRRQNETIFQHGVSPFSLDVQIVQFDEFKARTSDLYNQAKKPSERSNIPRPEDFSKAIYTFDIGQNDLGAGLRTMSYEKILASIPDILDQFSGAVQNLYEQGARTFWIHNTGPIGCLPASLLYFKPPKPGLIDKYGCIKDHNAMAVEFNKQLKDRVIKLRAQLPHASLTYVDIFAAKYGLISDTKNQGFVGPIEICCGHHHGDYHVWCGQKENRNGTEVYGGSCANPSAYVNWDGIHYSQAANHWIANHVLNGSLSEPHIPIAQACHKRLRM